MLFGATLFASEGFFNNLSKSFMNPIGYWLFLPGLFFGGFPLIMSSWELNRTIYPVLGYLMVGVELVLLWNYRYLSVP